MRIDHISLEEMDALHERLANLFRAAGFKPGPDFDQAIADTLTTALTAIDRNREGKHKRKLNLKVVED